MLNQKSPDKNSSDLYGRPNGLSYTHIIDSSVLPRISAFPITFTTMANAVRIASHFENFKDEIQ
jgi:choline dehydrogenase-like flavoprotein